MEKMFTGKVNGNEFTVDESTAWDLITALSEARDHAKASGRNATARSYDDLKKQITRVVTTHTERLIRYHEYCGQHFSEFLFDGYGDDGYNKVILCLDNGYTATEYLSDENYDKFVESFDELC